MHTDAFIFALIAPYSMAECTVSIIPVRFSRYVNNCKCYSASHPILIASRNRMRRLHFFSVSPMLYAVMAIMFFAAGGPAMAAGLNDPFSTYAKVPPSPSARDICSQVRADHALSMSEVIDLAMCNNPQTRVSWAAARAQAAQLGASMASYLPTLTVQGSGTRSMSRSSAVTTTSNQGSASLSASYLLYDFGGREASVENARQLLVAANANDDATIQNLFLSVVQAYYDLLSAKANSEALRVAENSAREGLAAAQTRFHAGAATPADVLQAKTALSQAQLNLITAEGSERDAQGTLANVMNISLTYPLELAPPPSEAPDLVTEKDIGHLLDLAREQRPDLAAAEAQIKAAEASVKAARASGMPQISLDASATASNTTTTGLPVTAGSRYGSIGVTVTFPLFSGFKTQYQTQAAEAQLQNDIASRDQLANQIALEVWKAYQALLTNSQALRTAGDLVDSATQSEQVALGRYRAGVGNILDLLTAQSALASARQQQVAALYNWRIAKFSLAQSIGVLDLTALDRIHAMER
jgi:outer membrane protein